MIPVLGPSNARDTVGLVADTVTDPFYYIFDDEAALVELGVSGLDKREAALGLIDNIESTSLDPYATIRSLYTQKRWDDIRNGKRY
jgi:phospholipid-binding lipoprotein MlaA